MHIDRCIGSDARTCQGWQELRTDPCVRPVVLFYVPAFLAGAASVCLTAGIDRWRVAPFLVLGAFLCLSTLTDVNAGVTKVRISGVLIGLTIAIELLGPGPAAVLGVVTMLVSWDALEHPGTSRS